MRLLAGIALMAAFSACSATAMALRGGPAATADWLSAPLASFELALGENPSPVHLLRPPAAPLSPLAQLGRQIFFDKSLSASGKLSCAACHSPQNDYVPADTAPAEYGGPSLAQQGARAVPSLMYLQAEPPFSIGPDPSDGAEDPVALPQLAALAASAPRAQKTADSTAASAANFVPQGGLFWDGRASTLPDQAIGPLQNPIEMDGGSIQNIAAKLLAAPYAQNFAAVFPPGYTANPDTLVSDAVIAISRYEVEDPQFHPYASKYDAWLEGKARLSAAEMRGYVLFNDPKKGDCGACHLDQPGPNGEPPLFTDHQFEALGVPRNPDLAANQNPAYDDLGICGPFRKDLAAQTQYCGMFLTPTLRNVARKNVFFHNGVYNTLKQVLDFYNFRDTQPDKIYPKDAAGNVQKFNDLPRAFWPNIDTADPPFDRQLGQSPPLTPAEEQDIIAFLGTLDDR